ncbi:hypothetical protein R1flu_016372 [Riccia fluitans]|uniref:Uncharacterized protein n=1 Tax=Riccia fluitans TaxID=41844 RepID=A0ABD1YM46_9MARC
MFRRSAGEMKKCSSGKISGAEHGTYTLTLDQEREAMLQSQRQARQERLLQVRAQEMHLAAKCAGEFRQRRKRDNLKLLQVLKEAWQEEQAKRLAALEADYVNRCEGIGQSYAAAHLLAGSSGDQKVHEAEVDELWRKLRFQRALQEEKARKQEVLLEKTLAQRRRKILSEASRVERLRTRNFASQARFKVTDEEKIVRENHKEGPEKYLKIDINTNVTSNIIHSRTPASPSGYKDTYFHSRLSVVKDRVSRRTFGSSEDDKETEVDAWEAAESQRKTMEQENERKLQLDEKWERRKAERGQAAAVKLQKIALLGKELAIELEEEQALKRQLQMIEDLTKAVQSPVLRPDTWKRLQSTLSQAELDADCEQKTEESDTKVPDPKDSLRATDLMVPNTASKGESEGVPSSPCVVGDEITAQAFPSNIELKENVDEVRNHELEPEDVATEDVKPAGTKEEQSTNGPSQTQVPDLCTSGATCKYADKNGVGECPHAESAKLLHQRPLPQLAAGGAKAQRDSRSRSKFSSSSTFNRKNGVRKGNKSPEKFEGERKVPTGREQQEAGRYVKELQARSVEIAKDQARPSVGNSGEAVGGKAASPAKEYRAERCTTEAKGEASPRKDSNSWLSNILEKLPWWKCDTSGKEFSGTGVKFQQENFRASGEQADRPYGCETARSVQTPRTKLRNEEPSQEVPAARKNVVFKMETLGSLNTLRDIDWYCEEEKPGPSRTQAKVVFTHEELETLKLELYGTLTGETITSQQKKVILGKEKVVKQGQRGDLKQQQRLNPQIPPHVGEVSVQKSKAFDAEVNQISRYQVTERKSERLKSSQKTRPAGEVNQFLRWQNAETKSEHRKSPTSNLEMEKFVRRHGNKVSNEGANLPDKKIEATAFSGKNHSTAERHEPNQWLPNKGEHSHQKKPSTRDTATQCIFADKECVPVPTGKLCETVEEENEDVKAYIRLPDPSLLQEKGKKSAAYMGPSDEVKTVQSSCVNLDEASDISRSNNENRKFSAPSDKFSAHAVAGQLIKAWRAGKIGGDIHAAFDRARQSRTQVSRKRRAAADTELKGPVSSNFSEASQKLGQLREKMNNSQHKSASKFRKWDVLRPPYRDENQGVSPCEDLDDSKSIPTLNGVHSSLKASNLTTEEECSQFPEKHSSEDSTLRRVEDFVPEARSLDYILGSLSAQVRELDERLQNVTACSIGTPIHRSHYEEQSTTSAPCYLTESTSPADRVNTIPAINSSHSLRVIEGDPEKVKGISVPACEAERVNGAGRDVMAPRKHPFIISQIDSLSYLQNDEKLDGFKPDGYNLQTCDLSPSSKPQVQSPGSSMGICLEDMAELMQEMSSSPACERMRAQLLQDSFLDSLLRRRESERVNVEQDDIKCTQSVNKFRIWDTSCGIKTLNCHQEHKRTEDFSFDLYTDTISNTVDSFGVTNAEKQMGDGTTMLPADAVSEDPSRQAGRISVSSLDLIEAMKLDGNEERSLLSSSVDFSPWNTEIIPDVFTSITNLNKGINYAGSTRESKDDGAKPDQCHLEESSKYQSRNSEFKKKCKAFEKKRLGRAKGNHKKAARKPFNPLALPAKRAPIPKSTTCSLQPGPLKLSKEEIKLTKLSRPKSKLASRSLPDDFHSTVAAEEVQKWLGREAVLALDESKIGRKRSGVNYSSMWRPVTAEDRLPQQRRNMFPAPEMTSLEVTRRQLLDGRSSIMRESNPRSRPASAGVVFSRR